MMMAMNVDTTNSPTDASAAPEAPLPYTAWMVQKRRKALLQYILFVPDMP
ncbi:unnamed protein product [Ectocarpus sp. CCAP 1310/34]|nr:unnamed protein product [Ectocarpus sp. CCAP 1310/34]